MSGSQKNIPSFPRLQQQVAQEEEVELKKKEGGKTGRMLSYSLHTFFDWLYARKRFFLFEARPERHLDCVIGKGEK